LSAGLFGQEARAGGAFAISTQGAYALGTAFSGVAAGSAGLPSIYWNPATITRFDGRNVSGGATYVFPYADITPQAGTAEQVLDFGGTGDIAEDAFIPTFQLGWEVISEKLWLGVSVNSPFGLATHAPDTTASQLYGRKSEAVSFTVSPTVGYKVNDWLSVGAAVQLLYFESKLTAADTAERESSGNEITGDGYGIGYSLGVTITPAERTTIGIGYRSRIETDQEGDFSSGLSTAGQSVDIETTLTLPEMLTVSLEQVVNEKTKVFATYEFTGWHTFDSFPIKSDLPPPGLPAQSFWYDDGHFFSVGGEHEVIDDKLNLVGGVGYQISPVGDEVRGVRLPDSNLFWVGLGGRYKRSERLSIDFAYAHVFPESATVEITGPDNPAWIPGNSNNYPYVGDVDARSDMVSFGINYHWN
jgi:long-chain fatty acid transport protein